MTFIVSQETETFTPRILAQIRMVLDGRRKHVFHSGKLCSGCYGPREEGRIDPYCRVCRRNYMRDSRTSHKARMGAG